MDQSLVFFFEPFLNVDQVLGDVALVDETLTLGRVQLFRCSQKFFVERIFVDLLKSDISMFINKFASYVENGENKISK